MVLRVFAWALSQHAPRLLVNPVINYINYIGKSSFSIYLAHFAVLHALHYYGYDNFIALTRMVTALADIAVRGVVVGFFSIVLATLLYHLVEVPGQNFGKRLIAHLERD